MKKNIIKLLAIMVSLCIIIAITIIFISNKNKLVIADVVGIEVIKVESNKTNSKPVNIEINKLEKTEMPVPILNQNDERWQDLPYGNVRIKEGGCAIVSLAMVISYIKQSEITPVDILNWSGSSYYVPGQGTSWEIFNAFAHAYQLHMEDYGNNINSAIDALKVGKVVVVSVKPGMFTKVGHIMVLKGLKNGNIILNDPNDNSEKQHNYTEFSPDLLATNGIQYWGYYA